MRAVTGEREDRRFDPIDVDDEIQATADACRDADAAVAKARRLGRS